MFDIFWVINWCVYRFLGLSETLNIFWFAETHGAMHSSFVVSREGKVTIVARFVLNIKIKITKLNNAEFSSLQNLKAWLSFYLFFDESWAMVMCASMWKVGLMGSQFKRPMTNNGLTAWMEEILCRNQPECAECAWTFAVKKMATIWKDHQSTQMRPSYQY